MLYSFQDTDNLYLIMELFQGGDLRYNLAKHRRFNEKQTSKHTHTTIYIYNNIKNFL